MFHHAELDYVMLNVLFPLTINWLLTQLQVGIGAIVLNPATALVQEAVGPSSLHDVEKPGLENGEDISMLRREK